jgi:heme A synthase
MTYETKNRLMTGGIVVTVLLLLLWVVRTAEREPPRYQIITIDGCQYIAGAGGRWMVHKANCTNPIHKVKAETP